LLLIADRGYLKKYDDETKSNKNPLHGTEAFIALNDGGKRNNDRFT